MAYSFGDDAFIHQLKEVKATGDRDALMALAWRGLEPVVAMELRKSDFGMFNAQDREDAKQEAMLYVYKALDGFLDNPLNDPACEAENRYTPAKRQGWVHLLVNKALMRTRDRIKKHALSPGAARDTYERVESLDKEIGTDGDSREADFIPADGPAPDQALLLRERLAEAMEAFFGLKNSPELLAAVGFVILSEALTGAHRSLDAYADLLNGMPALSVVGAIERMLGEYGVDGAVLAELRRRLNGDGERTIEGLTAKTLANRKNSMLSTLRAQPPREED